MVGKPSRRGGEFLAAAAAGQTSAVAGQLQRDLEAHARRYGDLFTSGAFDSTMFSSLSLAIAFSAPKLRSQELCMAARSTLWTVGLDWCIDTAAKTIDDVNDVVGRCRAIGDGRQPTAGDGLATFLADIRAELSTTESYAALRSLWREELDRLLDAEKQDWQWRSSASRPDLDEYLANSDSIALSFVYVCHMIHGGTKPQGSELDGLQRAGWAAQRVVRLNNDLASIRRDRASGDLNALLLPGVTTASIRRRIKAETSDALDLIEAVRPGFPSLATYLERQMGFCTGLYGVSDFWHI